MKSIKTALVDGKYKFTFVIITSLFFMWGFAHAILDVLNKHFQEVMHISKADSAFVQVMFYLGYFTMAIPAGLWISRKGYRAGVKGLPCGRDCGTAALRCRVAGVHSGRGFDFVWILSVFPLCDWMRYGVS